MAIKRETAIKCRVSDLVNSRYVKREGWEANYFETVFGKISRVNILGVVVLSQENILVIDDGSGSIQLRNFENNQTFDQTIGTLVMIIGRPRSFNEQVFIVPEIIKKIDNPLWVKYRTLELNLQPKKKINKITQETKTDNLNEQKKTTAQEISIQTKPEIKIKETQNNNNSITNLKKELEEEKSPEISETKKENLNLSEMILDKIIKMDKGPGVIIENILKEIDSSSANNTIKQLIEEGEIFEIKPGIVKAI